MNQKNWAGNYTYGAARWHTPQTTSDVQDVVKGADKVKVVGSRHSFNDIADTPGDIISLERLEPVMAIDQAQNTVTISGNVRYGELCRYLYGKGFALPNLASLPHITVAGACATATHGSGDKNGNLATSVSALEMVAADGQVVDFSRDKEEETFQGAVVGLGGLGVVAKMTLDLLPAFEVRQDVYEHLPWSQLEEHFDEITASAYSVSLFTDWQGDGIEQVWLKHRQTDNPSYEAASDLFGARLAARKLHPIAALSAENCTEQMGVHGPWHERLPHFRLDFTPSSGEELQSEYFVPRQQAAAALRAVREVRRQIAPLLLISEIRTIAADSLWLSPCYRQDSVAIHFTWQRDWAGVRKLLPVIEEQLTPFAARPHWGKLFMMPPERLAALYEKLPAFRQLAQQLDPAGKFRNEFLDRTIFHDTN